MSTLREQLLSLAARDYAGGVVGLLGVEATGALLLLAQRWDREPRNRAAIRAEFVSRLPAGIEV